MSKIDLIEKNIKQITNHKYLWKNWYLFKTYKFVVTKKNVQICNFYKIAVSH